MYSDSISIHETNGKESVQFLEDQARVRWIVLQHAPDGEMSVTSSGVGGRFVLGELVCFWKNGQSCNMLW